MNYLDQILQAIENGIYAVPDSTLKLLYTIIAILACILLNKFLIRFVKRYAIDASRRYISIKRAYYFSGLLFFILVLWIWLGSVTGVLAFLGILSAGIALAFKDLLANLAGWFFIIIRKPFKLEDRIEIDNIAGDVVDLRIFEFSILEIGNWVDADQSTGRIIHIPNGWIFHKPVANYTSGLKFIWDEMPVTITFESDWEKAKKLLQSIASECHSIDTDLARQQIVRASERYMIHYTHLTPIVWTRVVEHGVTLTLRYLCEVRRRRSTETELWERILKEFAKADDIQLAYPTQRIYFNPVEGGEQSPNE